MMRQRVGLDHAMLKSTFANMLSFCCVQFTVNFHQTSNCSDNAFKSKDLKIKVYASNSKLF